MIIGRDLMVHLGFTAYFKRQFFQWDVATVHIKDPITLLGQSDLTKREMREVVMQTSEPASTQEDTEWIVKSLDSNYVKTNLEQAVATASQLNT